MRFNVNVGGFPTKMRRFLFQIKFLRTTTKALKNYATVITKMTNGFYKKMKERENTVPVPVYNFRTGRFFQNKTKAFRSWIYQENNE